MCYVSLSRTKSIEQNPSGEADSRTVAHGFLTSCDSENLNKFELKHSIVLFCNKEVLFQSNSFLDVNM
jgi:hypothetical protein